MSTTQGGQTAGAPTTSTDGRSARRQRNRDAVVDAYIDLTAEGHLDPTAELVSDRAGVSHRSVYRYFGTRTELLEAAIARVMDRVAAAVAIDPLGVGPLNARIREFVRVRTATHRQFAPIVQTALRRAATEQVIAGVVDTWRRVFRQQMEQQFAPEIERIDNSSRDVVVDLIDMAFQFESLDYLSREIGNEGDALDEVLEIHLHRYLDDLAKPA